MWRETADVPLGRRAAPDVLVLDAQFRQSVIALRSLARAGAIVGGVACESEHAAAAALRSRQCRFSAVVPDFERDEEVYAQAILALLDAHPVRLIVPSHDGAIQALRRHRAEIERRTFLPLASESALDIAVSKTRTLALAEKIGLAVPRSLVIRGEDDLRPALAELGCPAVIKPISSWGQREGFGKRLGAESVESLDDARRELARIQAIGLTAVMQQWLPGRRDAVSVFRAHGRTWARFAQTSYREFPPLGGSSVLCESIALEPDLVAPTDALVEAADLDGCSMVEFRRDREGRPVLMEINARMAGSVELAIRSGVDFPKLLYMWALGRPIAPITEYRVGRRQRWLSGDAWHLKCVFEGAGRIDTPGRGDALATFVLDFFRRPARLDLFEAGDVTPALVELQHGLVEPMVARASKSPWGFWRRIPERTDGSNER